MEEIIERLELLEYRVQFQARQNEELQSQNESLQIKLNKIENVQTSTTIQLEYYQQQNELLKEQIGILSRMVMNKEDVEEILLDSSNSNERKIASVIISTDREVEPDCIDLIIDELLDNYSVLYLQSLRNIICQCPESVLKKYQKDVFTILQEHLNGNMIETECCVDILLALTSMYFSIPNEVLNELANAFSNDSLITHVKLNILIIMSMLSKDQLHYFIKIIHKIIFFCLNPLYLKEDHYGFAMVVFSKVLPLLPKEILVLVCRDIVKMDIWKVDYGEEWRKKNLIDPHGIILMLLENEDVVKVLQTSVINKITYLEYILNHLELRSDDSLNILFHLCLFYPKQCEKFIVELIQIYPFGGDIESMITCSDIFLYFLDNCDVGAFNRYFKLIVNLIDQYIIADPRLKEKSEAIHKLLANEQ